MIIPSQPWIPTFLYLLLLEGVMLGDQTESFRFLLWLTAHMSCVLGVGLKVFFVF